MSHSIISKIIRTRILKHSTRLPNPTPNPPCDVFINHRGVDTKKSIAGLLFQRLSSLGFNPFLDCKSMRPGDKLLDKINPGIRNCRVGVVVFSKRYCESHVCLHELALMVECKKKVIPVFWDVKPSELRIVDNDSFSIEELERFKRALEEAKNTVGLTFDTSKRDWSEFLTNVTDAITQSLLEVEGNQE